MSERVSDNLRDMARELVEMAGLHKSTMPDDDLPTFFEPVTAWKAWVISEDESPRLMSITGARMRGGSSASGERFICEPLIPGEAECLKRLPYQTILHEEPAPADGCTCGFYGASSIHIAQGYLSWNRARSNSSTFNARTCIGLVSLWGEVIEFSNGYRAQYAYPKEIWLPPQRWRNDTDSAERWHTAKALADLYGIEAHVIQHLSQIPDWSHRYSDELAR